MIAKKMDPAPICEFINAMVIIVVYQVQPGKLCNTGTPPGGVPGGV